MGEVYRGRDTRLDRSVAIKVLPVEMAGDTQLKLRLEREARTISQLNHPNICTLYDVGRENGRDFLVMELLEGETLADRLARGPLPVDQVLKYGLQIAEALDKAHRQGIVHRDLKPGNVMITKSGVKLLDFGLAKTVAPLTIMAESESPSATEHKPLTQEGTIVGTFQYMAPEQLEGAEADPRTDIFAFGVLLYEMTTGRLAFEGKSKASLIAAILSAQPAPISTIQPLAPPALDHVIGKCMEKDADERWQSAHDIAEELRWIARMGSQAGVAAPIALRRKTRERLLVGGLVAAVLVAAAAGWGWWRASSQERPIARLAIPLPSDAMISRIQMPAVAISPDGQHVVFSAFAEGPRLFSRPVGRIEAVAIPGTAGGAGPFFSPDGEWIGFATLGELKKVRRTGGAAQTLTRVENGRGAFWGSDSFIYYTPSVAAGLWRVSATDPRPEQLTTPDENRGENSHRWPQLLPDGKHVLFTIRTDRIVSFDEAKIAVLSLETGRWRTILEGGSYARYVSPGYIVFGQRGALYAVPFDLGSMTVAGSPVAVIEGLLTSDASGAAHYAVAERQGTIIYLPGSAEPPRASLATVDRMGRKEPLTTIEKRVSTIRLSPDQKRLAIQVAAANDDIWVHDLERATLTRVSFEPGDEWFAVWNAAGDRVVYGKDSGVYWQPVDGSVAAEQLASGRAVRFPACSPDGRFIAYAVFDRSTDSPDLWLLNLESRKALPLLRTPYAEFDPVFSPDSQWIAYVSNASGALEVYLRRVAGGGQWQISTSGGFTPRWSRDGRELFYRSGDDFFAVPITLRDTPPVGKPQLLFTLPEINSYEVFGDGFLVWEASREIAGISNIHVVLEWLREVQSRIDG